MGGARVGVSAAVAANTDPSPPSPVHTQPKQRQRRAVEAVYEARPVPGDHKLPAEQGGNWSVS